LLSVEDVSFPMGFGYRSQRFGTSPLLCTRVFRRHSDRNLTANLCKVIFHRPSQPATMPYCGTRTERQGDLMYSSPSVLKSVRLAGAASAIALSAAQAVEAEDAGKRLTNLLAVQQIELTYGSAAMDGEDVVLSEAKAKYPEDDEVVELGDLTLEDVTEEGNGDYRVAR